MRCIVVGGGIAGIAAAWKLAPVCQVLLLEQRSVLGGRASSLVDRVSGEEVDTGQHLLMGCYQTTLQLLADLGTPQWLYQWRDWRIHFRTVEGKAGVLSPGLRMSAAARFLRALVRFSLLSIPDRWRLIYGITKLVTSASAGQSCEQFLREVRQTPAAHQIFWRPLILATLNAEPADVDVSLLRTVVQQAFLGSVHEGAFVIPRRGLSALIAPITSWIQRYGGAVRLQAAVEQVCLNGDSAAGVQLRGGEVIPADVVVLAVPPYALQKLGVPITVPPLHYSPIFSIYLWFAEELPLPPMTALVGTTVQWVFHRQQLQFQTSSQFQTSLVLVISAARDLLSIPVSQLVEHCWEEVRSVFRLPPSVRPAHFRVMKEVKATPVFTPAVQLQRPAVQTPLQNVFLAGDWIQTGLPATIESAAYSGVLAATAVQQYLQKGASG